MCWDDDYGDDDDIAPPPKSHGKKKGTDDDPPKRGRKITRDDRDSDDDRASDRSRSPVKASDKGKKPAKPPLARRGAGDRHPVSSLSKKDYADVSGHLGLNSSAASRAANAPLSAAAVKSRQEDNRKLLVKKHGKDFEDNSTFQRYYGTSKQRAAAKRTVIKTTPSPYTPEIQTCRWIATVLFGVGIEQDFGPEEVQTLFDPQAGKFFVAANKNSAAAGLSEVDFEREVEQLAGRLDELVANGGKLDPQRIRLRRQAAKVATCYQACNMLFDELSADHPNLDADLDGLLRCPDLEPRVRKALLLRRLRQRDACEFVRSPGMDKMHAEIKLVHKWVIDNRDFIAANMALVNAGQPIVNRRTIYVAGVKRPCTVCSVRLMQRKIHLAAVGVDLVFKENSRGLFWNTASAMSNMNEADMVRLTEILADESKDPLNFTLSAALDKHGHEVEVSYGEDSASESQADDYEDEDIYGDIEAWLI